MPKALPVIDMSTPVCCRPVATGAITDDDALQIALRLKALADPASVKMMSLPFGATGERPQQWTVAAAIGAGESTISHHLDAVAQRRTGGVDPAGYERLSPSATCGVCGPRRGSGSELLRLTR